MTVTRNPNCDDENGHANDAEFPKLVAAQQAEDGQVGKWEKSCA